MEYVRGIGPSNLELNLLIQATEDRLFNLHQLGIGGLTANDCLPESARCSDGPSSLPGFKAIMLRAILQSVERVENKIKLALYPRRKTNFAKTPREVYENRVKFSAGGLDSFLTPSSREYPTWDDLTATQRLQYNDTESLYRIGTLPWDLLTAEQKRVFASGVIYVPNKVSNEERIDGKDKAYIKLYERYVRRIHKLALEVQDPAGLGIPYLNRVYSPSEYFIYPKEGALILFPAQARLSATGTNSLVASSGYGMTVPRMPQIITVDYEFGLDELPRSIQDAVALYSAIRVFELVNIAFTKGMMSYSVQGFSASFGKGMYADIMQRYKDEADELLHPFYQMVLAGW